MSNNKSKKKKQQEDTPAQDTAATQEIPAVEPEIAEQPEAAPEIDLDALRAEVEGILKDKEDTYRALAQVSADFDNYKKRNAQLRLDVENNTRRDVAGLFLPVLDNLERAVQAAQSGEGESLTKGVQMVCTQFLQVFTDLGIEEIPADTGTAFDPEMHNAVAVVPAEDGHPDNTVYDVLQKGYRMGDKVIRYAMVRVAQK